MDRIVLVRNPK